MVYSPHESIPTCIGPITFPDAIDGPIFIPQPQGALHNASAGMVSSLTPPPAPPMRIPRIIHIMEEDGQSPGELAVSAYASHQREKVMHINYTTMRWNITGFRAWMAERYPWYLHRLDILEPLDKIHVAPYFILDVYGGIALSSRYVPRVDLYPYLAPERVNMLESNMPLWEPVSTALLASAPRHPFWELVHTRLVQKKVVLGSYLIGEMERTYPIMGFVLQCRYFNRIPERSTHWIKKNTALRRKCGVEQDPCLYGSILEYS